MDCLFKKIIENNNLRKVLSITAVMFISLLFLFTGCARRIPEVNKMMLQNETGDFQYADISWGTDETSAATALGITFDQGTISTASSHRLCLATDACTMMMLPATVYCEFDDSGLYSIRFRISPADGDVETCWDTLTAALLTQYGSADPVCQESTSSPDRTGSQIRVQSEFYLWEHSDTVHTALSATKTSINGNTPMIELSVYVIPPDRK